MYHSISNALIQLELSSTDTVLGNFGILSGKKWMGWCCFYQAFKVIE